MGETFTELIAEQSTNVALLQRVLPNFKKLGKALITLPKVTKRAESLDALWEKMQRLHTRILQVANAEQKKTSAYFISEEFFEAEDTYQEAADHFADTIAHLRSASARPAQTSNASQSISGNFEIQLPRIQLPKFSGNFTE